MSPPPPRSTLFPYTTLFRSNELDDHADVVTYCHHGARSLKALEILKAAGFAKVRSLRGGIDAWAVNVRSEEHTSELQSHSDLVCRLLLEKKNKDVTGSKAT